MRWTLFTLGSRGDVQPYLALGKALQARGQDVTLCAPENFRALTLGLGLDFVGTAWNTRALAELPELRGSLLRGRTLQFFLGLRRELLKSAEGAFDAWIAAAQGADALLATSTTEDWVVLLGAALGKPVAHTEVTPFTPSAFYAPLRAGVDTLGPLNGPAHRLQREAWWALQRPLAAGLARRLGLKTPLLSPSLRSVAKGAKMMHGFSPALFETPRDWDPGVHFVSGCWRLEASDARALPGDHQDAGFADWLEDGPPPVYLSFGSMPTPGGAEALELAGDLAELLGLRVVLGAGWSAFSQQDADLPEGVAVGGDCDHAWLFERCCAVVHHGGAGTTHAVAAAGLPQVVCPVFADQPFWAQRVLQRGVGNVVPYGRLDARRLARALDRTLSGSCPEAAAVLAEAMRSDPGAQGAAQSLMDGVRGEP